MSIKHQKTFDGIFFDDMLFSWWWLISSWFRFLQSPATHCSGCVMLEGGVSAWSWFASWGGETAVLTPACSHPRKSLGCPRGHEWALAAPAMKPLPSSAPDKPKMSLAKGHWLKNKPERQKQFAQGYVTEPNTEFRFLALLLPLTQAHLSLLVSGPLLVGNTGDCCDFSPGRGILYSPT